MVRFFIGGLALVFAGCHLGFPNRTPPVKEPLQSSTIAKPNTDQVKGPPSDVNNQANPTPKVDNEDKPKSISTQMFDDVMQATELDDKEDHLGQAANRIEAGDEAGAVPHMLKHIQQNPDQVMIRAYLAEILLKLKRFDDAKLQFEEFIEQAQLESGNAKNHLVHCHTRLMEIAQEKQDTYLEHLNRGIGYYLLAQKLIEMEGTPQMDLIQPMLTKAIKELTLAFESKPKQARACWYLSEVMKGLDQPKPREKWLRLALDNADFSPLTLAERSGLNWARYELK